MPSNTSLDPDAPSSVTLVWPAHTPLPKPRPVEPLTLDALPASSRALYAADLRLLADLLDADAANATAARTERKRLPMADLLRSEGWIGALQDVAARLRERADSIDPTTTGGAA